MSAEQQGAGLVWSMQELRAVRESGLVGALVGCLPRAPRQNTRLGRPLLLRGEELALRGEELALRGEESARRGEESAWRGEESVLREEESMLREEESALREEESEETQEQQWEEFLGRSLEQQRQLALDDRKSALMSSLSGSALASALAALDNFVLPRSAIAVQLSTCREGLPLRPIRSQHGGSETMGEELTVHSEGRVQVFRDLRRRGFYLTSGGKFGVDFLVYPGDALRFHAHFMALCVSLEDSVSLEDILSWIRLSSSVKKTLLLCSSSPLGGVLYSSLQWSNMS